MGVYLVEKKVRTQMSEPAWLIY